ncbi:uncharacterized protein LOC109793916 [Cajanus cajan]|uniref:uncharacterized protein LOC109793916 n=1 Tax=Cajanus cajan TaxID=3821 RepID=UPI0010FBA10A|nr:uncharacterized protein LOC109793916 [Cajanus cajan]
MEDQSYADFTTNPYNPYYLHPNETPSLVLVTPLLDGKNYHTRARAMRMALMSKHKVKFIDGTLTPPHSSSILFEPWGRCNTMVISWLQHSISEKIVKSILWFDTASDIWQDLKARFSQGDVFRVAQLQEDLYKFHQGSLDVTEYFTQLKEMWDEIDNLRPLSRCKCSIACSCGAVDSSYKYREQDAVIRFLRGLNDQYTHVRSQIMLMDPLPSLSKTFSLVGQQERHLNQSAIHDDTKVLAATSFGSLPQTPTTQQHQSPQQQQFGFRRGGYSHGRGRGRGGRTHGSIKICTHCGRNNHTVDTCYFKHGFPPGYQSKGGTSANFTVNAVETTSPSSMVPESNNPNFGFTQEQCQELLSLLQQSKTIPTPSSHSANSVVSSPLAMNFNSNASSEFYQEDDWYS